ncbi:unnamed protein product [Leptosia nina]|uniref:Uncharacterized protein n=1 Tax=Leptosia nina TaxID=320188 RepID=A0AAV1J9D4_9NEOP
MVWEPDSAEIAQQHEALRSAADRPGKVRESRASLCGPVLALPVVGANHGDTTSIVVRSLTSKLNITDQTYRTEKVVNNAAIVFTSIDMEGSLQKEGKPHSSH